MTRFSLCYRFVVETIVSDFSPLAIDQPGTCEVMACISVLYADDVCVLLHFCAAVPRCLESWARCRRQRQNVITRTCHLGRSMISLVPEFEYVSFFVVSIMSLVVLPWQW